MSDALGPPPTSRGPHLLIFDLSQHAHLPSYLRHLIVHWRDLPQTGQLDLLVWPSFLVEHADVVKLADTAPRRNVRFLALTPDERREKLARQARSDGASMPLHELLRTGAPAAYAAAYDWALLCRYVAETGADRVFVVALDATLPLLAAGAACPAPVSGIYFGSPFRHSADGNPVAPDLSAQFVLARALRSVHLEALFVLDPLVAARLARFPDGGKVSYAPDPVSLPHVSASDVQALAHRLEVELGRRCLLLCGHLTPRKGVEGLLAALALLPPPMARQVCLLLVGPVQPDYRAHLMQQVAAVRQVQPVQVIERYGYAPDHELAAYLGLADVVLTPYVGHLGSSGVLLLAAAAGKPVLSSEQGLMGELVRRHRLGLAVDTTSPQVMAGGLARLLADPIHELHDSAAMRRLAEHHSADRFATAIYRRLLDQCEQPATADLAGDL